MPVQQQDTYANLLVDIRKIIKEELNAGIEADELALTISELSETNRQVIKTIIKALKGNTCQ